MTADQQREFLYLIAQGCTALFACHQLGRTMRSLKTTLRGNQRFRREFFENLQLMDQRVESALYKAALKGNVSAQTLWLKNRPPQNWKRRKGEDQGSKRLEEMTDEEVLRLAKREGFDLSTEFDARAGVPEGEPQSEGVSAATEDSG